MNPRLLVLALPSALLLAALVWHSVGAMERRRALLFWFSVLGYGIARALGVRAVTEAIGASFPYEIRDPLLAIGGVSAQELAGWALVAYLAWWIGDRFSRRARHPSLFLGVAWAALFLGAVAWAIEAAAIGARWWHWTVPTASRLFLNVPAIGIVDWFFVAIDFLLPFVALTAPSLSGARWRFATLLFFPVHFAGHLLPGVWLHAVHWMLVLVALGLALRTAGADRPFAAVRAWIPQAAFALMLLDVALVDLLLVRRPELLQSVVAPAAAWLTAVHPGSAMALAFLSLMAALKWHSMLVTAALVACGSLLLLLQARKNVMVPLLLVAVSATLFHRATSATRADLMERLDHAINARNRGELDAALAQFDSIASDHPTSYVPLAMGAEIDYRRNALDVAHGKLARVVEMKQDFLRGYRLLAAIDLQRGRHGEGVAWARRGLGIAPDDLQLRFLAGEDVRPALDTPRTAAGMAALAFEINQTAFAREIAQEALARWPDDRELQRVAMRLDQLQD